MSAQGFRVSKSGHAFDQEICRDAECDVADVFVEVNIWWSAVAVESCRVPLQQIRGVEGSDYINASFIDVRLFLFALDD